MNRIRYWRERKGLSQAALARLVGMSQPNLARIESGQQHLTEGLMQRFAKALDVAPIDLLSLAIVGALQDDVRPDEIKAAPEIAAALRQRHISSFRIRTNVLESRGFKPGTGALVDTGPPALERLKTGDVVVAEIEDLSHPGSRYLVLREFIAPALLVTNRPGTNHAIRTDDDGLAVRIIGVAIPPTEG